MKASLAASTLALTMVFLAAPATGQAQDFERPGVYLSGGWAHLGEQFSGDLDDEIDAALNLDNPRLSVGDTDVWSGALGFRLGSRFALELVGEHFEDLPIDLSFAGVQQSGDLELVSGMVMSKFYLLTGRIQPYVMAGAGALRARIEFGDLSETGYAALGRAGAGVELYLNPNLAIGVQAAYSRALAADFDDIAFFTVGSSVMLRF